MDWKDILSKVAPMIGTAVGGPFGGMAASAALKLLDVEPEEGTEEAQLERVIACMTPEQAIKLQMAEKDWIATMKELDLKEQDLHAKDRDSARKMQMSTHSWVVPTLAIITVLGFFAVVGLILTGKVPLDSTLTSKDKTMQIANKP
jgi:hypothetical protein